MIITTRNGWKILVLKVVLLKLFKEEEGSFTSAKHQINLYPPVPDNLSLIPILPFAFEIPDSIYSTIEVSTI